MQLDTPDGITDFVWTQRVHTQHREYTHSRCTMHFVEYVDDHENACVHTQARCLAW